MTPAERRAEGKKKYIADRGSNVLLHDGATVAPMIVDENYENMERRFGAGIQELHEGRLNLFYCAGDTPVEMNHALTLQRTGVVWTVCEEPRDITQADVIIVRELLVVAGGTR
jgi:hypothetical protein